MSHELRRRIFDELNALVLIDPHTHINALNPGSQTLADILGYHYYTELAHSAGMPKGRIEEPGISPKEKVGRLVEGLGPIENTIQYSWLIEMLQTFFGFRDDRLTAGNWETVFDRSAQQMSSPAWPQEVLTKSKIEAVFLTNEFDDPLAGFDTKVYIPCLRTDDLCFTMQSRPSASGCTRRRACPSTTPRRCARRSASCSSISRARTAARARSRCRPTFRR